MYGECNICIDSSTEKALRRCLLREARQARWQIWETFLQKIDFKQVCCPKKGSHLPTRCGAGGVLVNYFFPKYWFDNVKSSTNMWPSGDLFKYFPPLSPLPSTALVLRRPPSAAPATGAGRQECPSSRRYQHSWTLRARQGGDNKIQFVKQKCEMIIVVLLGCFPRSLQRFGSVQVDNGNLQQLGREYIEQNIPRESGCDFFIYYLIGPPALGRCQHQGEEIHRGHICRREGHTKVRPNQRLDIYSKD